MTDIRVDTLRYSRTRYHIYRWIPTIENLGLQTFLSCVEGEHCYNTICYKHEFTVLERPAFIKNRQSKSQSDLKLKLFPNPFSHTVKIESPFFKEGKITKATIHSLNGVLLKQWPQITKGLFVWDGKDNRGLSTPPGLYFLRINIDGKTRWIKLVKGL